MRTIIATTILAALAWLPGATLSGAAAAPACVDAVTAARLHQGQPQRRVERHTGPGVRVMSDTLTYGVQYPACDPASELVVLYMRTTHRVASVLYVTG